MARHICWSAWAVASPAERGKSRLGAARSTGYALTALGRGRSRDPKRRLRGDCGGCCEVDLPGSEVGFGLYAGFCGRVSSVSWWVPGGSAPAAAGLRSFTGQLRSGANAVIARWGTVGGAGVVHAAGAIGAVSRRARDRLAGRVAARRVRAAAYRPMLRRSRARAQSWACARRLRAAQGEAHLPASKRCSHLF